MKLYATTTSERASKGQGGEKLYIDIKGQNKNLLWCINVLYLNNGRATIEIIEKTDNDNVVQLFEKKETKGKSKDMTRREKQMLPKKQHIPDWLKGKSQKGECKHSKLYLDNTNTYCLKCAN
jgi:hypothetical protein